jgi:hypothetical protein
MSSAFESNFAMLPCRINLRTAVKYQQAAGAWLRVWKNGRDAKTLVWRSEYGHFQWHSQSSCGLASGLLKESNRRFNQMRWRSCVGRPVLT